MVLLPALKNVHLLVPRIIIVIRGIPAATILTTFFSELQLHNVFLDYQGLFDWTIFLLDLLPRRRHSLLLLFLLSRPTHGDSQLVPEGLHEILEHGIPQQFRPANVKEGGTRTLVPKVVKGRTGPREHGSRLRHALVEGIRGWKVIAGSLRSIALAAILVKN